jgi:hypothetical protein
MRTRLLIPLALLACLLAAGCGGYSASEGGTSLPARDVFTLTTTHVGGHHVKRLHLTCTTQTPLCRAVEIALRPAPRTIGVCSCPAITATVTVTGTIDGHPFPARHLTVCSDCGRGARYQAALLRVLRAAGIGSARAG